MKIRTLLAGLALCAAGAQASAQTGLDNPMTRAVLGVYERQLREDPADYETWLNRANEYYRHNEYLKALNDVDQALRYIPSKDTDTRVQALTLRANIYTQTSRNDRALDDLNSIIILDPDNYVALYQRANALYRAGEYARAKTDFTRLQRLNPRSAEALVGLARIAVKENNPGTATTLLDQAVANDPNNADIYVRRASVRRQMGDNHGAVEDLVLALATDARNARAVKDLAALANTDYGAVMAGLADAIRQAPNVAMYRYLRAQIAQAHYNYKTALDDYRTIIDRGLNNYQGIYRSMAECEMALGDYDRAMADVDRALKADRNAHEAATLRATLLRNAGHPDQAITQAANALAIKPSYHPAMIEMALDYLDNGNAAQANDLIGEAMLTVTDNPGWYMLRAWILESFLNQPVAARGFYDKVIEGIEGAPDPQSLDSYRGFAMLFAGQQPQGRAWLDNALEQARLDGNDMARPYYLAACWFAQADDFDTALHYTAKALESGYANFHDWETRTDGRINTAPLRNDLRYLNLLQKYSHLR